MAREAPDVLIQKVLEAVRLRELKLSELLSPLSDLVYAHMDVAEAQGQRFTARVLRALASRIGRASEDAFGLEFQGII